jgi:hypothetical protein
VPARVVVLDWGISNWAPGVVDRTIALGPLAGLGWLGGLLSDEPIESDAVEREHARRGLAWWCARAREALELL